MRVLLVTTWYPTAIAPGSGIFVRNDAELIATTHDVRVVHLARPELLSAMDAVADVTATVPVTRIPMSTTDIRSIRRAWRSLGTHLAGADLLHTQAFSALLPFIGHRRPRLPWVHTEHWSSLSNPHSLPGRVRVSLPLLRLALRMPDVVTAVCDYLARPVRRVRAKPTIVVPCIVPPAEHLVEPPGRPDEVRIVAVGALTDRKDPLCAVDALAILRDDGVPAVLTWVGDGELRDAVNSRAQERGLSAGVRIMGVLDAAGVRSALDDADLFLLPTKAENFCVSAAEAIVQGRAAVVGANGGQAEYISPENGALVTEQTPVAYAAAVVDVLERLKSSTASQIAATIGDAFSPQQVLTGYLDAYQQAARMRG